ncbi:MAG: protein-L-isoaspartate(D-aspartate) O-methyltransferase [Saprospiraceae bacterium]|nr:protein-L-isoaspartate(D-aspartate) O-methyltransferase [Saprospiraceae bacterium]MBP7679759.1 protein-L-isoaspartate(D-aspartate) O-methyltransferase [Saprospiraceae bacterium]
MFNDTYRHKGLRKQLIDALRKRGVNDEAILTAMGTLPRHFFLDNAFEEWAYQDKAFPIANEQTISQPYTVAFQTALLQIQKREKVLEIGTGSGYQAAILAMLGARVFTVERQELLYQQAKELLSELGFGGVRCYLRDGTKGLPEFAPFDKILVTAGAQEIPVALKNQLKVGGMLVIPYGDAHTQIMYRITKLSEGKFKEEQLGDFRFVPLLEGLKKK